MQEIKLTKADILMFCEVYVQIGSKPLAISSNQLTIVTGQLRPHCEAIIAEIKANEAIPTEDMRKNQVKILPLKYIKKLTRLKGVEDTPTSTVQKKMFPHELDYILNRFKVFPGYRITHVERQVLHTMVQTISPTTLDEAVEFALSSDFWLKERRVRCLCDLAHRAKQGNNIGKMYIEIIVEKMIKERKELKHLMTMQG